MQMHVALSWFIIAWSSLMWPKDYLNMCHIFYYNFSVKFLQSTWIRPQKKSSKPRFLWWHHLSITIQQTLSFQKTRVCWTARAKCSLTYSIPQIHLYYLSLAGVLYHAIVKEHSALTVQHNLVFCNDNVYWMVIDKWCHLKNLGLEDFLWAYPSTLKKKKNYNKIYGTY